MASHDRNYVMIAEYIGFFKEYILDFFIFTTEIDSKLTKKTKKMPKRPKNATVVRRKTVNVFILKNMAFNRLFAGQGHATKFDHVSLKK